MRSVPVLPVGVVKETSLVAFFTAILRNLTTVLDYSVYTNTVVWKAPFDLYIPSGDSQARQTRPKIVRLGNAVVVNDVETPVDFGATGWTWKGGDNVKIFAQAGLVEGVKYDLTWEVVG